MIKNVKLILMLVLAMGMVSCSGNYRSSANCGSCNTCCDVCEMGPGPVDCTSCCGGLVTVDRHQPEQVALGHDFNVQLVAKARSRCTNVMISETVPEGLRFVASNPAATVDGNKLSWNLGDLQGGENQQVCITYQALEEGCYCTCYTVDANPCCCQPIAVGCPKLEICKSGPECVRVCCPVNYHIVVTNCGSMIARQVCLTDKIPAEMQHRSCCEELSWCLGDICPGESKSVDLCLTAIKCGLATNTATAQSAGCPPVTGTATTMVQDCCIKLTKTGPAGPIVVGKTADYVITAVNEGNTCLTDVKVTDIAPPGTRIKEAPGAEVQGTRAVWSVLNFAPGETKTFDVTLTSCVPGCLTNRAQVQCTEQCGDCAEASTRWIGVAGIWLGIKNTPDPVCVDMFTEFCVCVQNQGFAADTNVKLEVQFPDELEPISADVPTQCYRIENGKVIFEPTQTLEAGRTVYYKIKAKAKKPGDARVKVQVESDLLTSPVVKEESAQIY